MDGRVLWWKLRPFSERLSLAMRTEDSWALNVTSVWTKPQTQERGETGQRSRRETEDAESNDDEHKFCQKSNPADSSKPLYTRRGLCWGCCRMCIQDTAKNRNTRCCYPWVNMSRDYWFAVYVRSSQKWLFTPMRMKGLGLKAAVFTFMHLLLVRGLKTSGKGDQCFSNWVVWSFEGNSTSFFRPILLYPILSILICLVKLEFSAFTLPSNHLTMGKIILWLNWYYGLCDCVTDL